MKFPPFHFRKKPCCIVRLITLLIAMSCVQIVARQVTVDGVGYTKDAAVKAALRAAVEQTVGVRISSQSMVENYQVVRDNILSRADGFISLYSVVSEFSEFGLVKVRVNAEVSLGKLEDSLSAQQLLYEIANKPRIMVMLDERVEGKPVFEKTATHVVTNELLKRGFVVVKPEIGAFTGDGTPDEAANTAFKRGADLIIHGQVSVAGATPKMVYGIRLYTVPVQINASVIRTDNTQVLASQTFSIKKNSREKVSAGRIGLEKGGKEITGRLIRDLNAFWRSEAFNERRVVLSVLGIKSSDLIFLDSLLTRLRFVRSVNLRYFEENKAVYDLELRGTLQELRAVLSKRPETGFTVMEMSANRMTIYRGETPLRDDVSPVEIVSFTIRDIFPSLIHRYKERPPAKIVLACRASAVNDVKISINIPDFMSLPAEKKVSKLASGKETELVLPLIFDKHSIFNNVSEQSVYARATISYTDKRKSRTRTLTTPVTIYGKNAMDWRTPEAIASYVVYQDPAIDELAHAAVRVLPPEKDLNRDLLTALALFETMRSFKIKYVTDPASSHGKMILDRVQYPTETLNRLSGDCDDLSVLYAAMLSAVGIPAAIISYPDHVLVMFNTGIYEKNHLSLSCDTTKLITHHGTLWIPVETTHLNGDFYDAWHEAAADFHAALAGKTSVSIIELDRAWQSYPPAPVTIKLKEETPEGVDQVVASGLMRFRKRVEDERSVEIAKLHEMLSKSKVTGKEAAILWNRLGLLKVRNNTTSDAVDCFRKALLAFPTTALKSNLASALLISGNDTMSLKHYNSIYKKDTSGRIPLNRALNLFVTATTKDGVERFVSELKKVASILPNAAKLAEYLGIDLDHRSHTRAEERQEVRKPKNVDLRNLKALIRTRVINETGRKKDRRAGTTTESSTGTRVTGTTSETSSGSHVDSEPPVCMPFGGIRGADPAQVMKIIDLLYWFEEP